MHIFTNKEITVCIMERTKKRSRLSGVQKGLIITGAVVLVLAGVWLGVQAWLGHRITKLLETEPINLDGRMYAAKIEKVRVDLARRSVTLTGLTVSTPRSARSRKNSPVPVLDASIKRVSASGIRYHKDKKSSEKSIAIRTVEIESPKITCEGVPSAPKDTTASRRQPQAKKIRLQLDKLRIMDGDILVSVWEGPEKNSFSAGGLDLTLTDIALGPELPQIGSVRSADSTEPRTPLLPGAEVSLAADSLSYTYKNGAMKLEAESLLFDSGTEALSATRIALIPQYSKYQYSLRVADHSDWTELIVDNIDCLGIKLPMSPDDTFHADSIKVGGVRIDSYKDRNQPQSPRIKPTLYESVERIPIGIDVPSIDAAGINIRYEEVAKGASIPAVITFTDMDAHIAGLTNRPAAEAQHYTIEARGYLLGSALVDATLMLPADSLNNKFSVKATVGPMSATIASPVTEPIANIRIVSGNIQSVAVEISGDSYRAQSVVDMRYTDLRIAIMRKNDPDREREFLTTIANDIVLRRDNPLRDKLRIGHGTFERDPYKSFWNYLWKTSFAGVSDVVM